MQIVIYLGVGLGGFVPYQRSLVPTYLQDKDTLIEKSVTLIKHSQLRERTKIKLKLKLSLNSFTFDTNTKLGTMAEAKHLRLKQC